MKTRITFFLLYLLIQSFVSHSNFNDSTNKYWENIEKAHIALCQEQYEEASSYFDKAFPLIKKPFFADLNNAIYVQIKQQNTDSSKVIHWLQSIQNKGICIHERYTDEIDFVWFLDKVSHEKCIQIKSNSLSASIEKLYATDQVLRVFSDDILGQNYDPKLLPAIDRIDSVNFFLIDSILTRCFNRGEPLEEFLGYKATEHIFIILQHNAPWGRHNELLLKDLVTTGIADVREISFLLDNCCNGNYGAAFRDLNWSNENGCDPDYKIYGTRLCQNLNGKQYIVELDSIALNTVNRNRKSIYLGDIYNEAKIKAYMGLNKNKGLYYPGLSIFKLEGMNQRFEKNYRGHKYIKYNNLDDFVFNRAFTRHN